MSSAELTKEQILTQAAAVLTNNGFTVSSNIAIAGVDSSNHRVFEDSYCVGMIIVFEDWKTLKNSWMEIQTSLIEAVSRVLAPTDKKSWEVYLVLLTTGFLPIDENTAAKAIKYDTNRVRKLLSTGEDLRDASDVEASLLPLLPIEYGTTSISEASILARLPEILGADNSLSAMITVAVDAFEQQESISTAIYRLLGDS